MAYDEYLADRIRRQLKVRNYRILYLLIAMIVLNSCNEKETTSEILLKTINKIDTIETIYYKQDMSRSNPQYINDTIFRFREMYFKRLINDFILILKFP